MRLLLDTHVYIWTLSDSRKLSAKARRLIDEAEEIYVSAATIWEMAIKSGLGKLEGDPSEYVASIQRSGYRELAVTAAHGGAILALEMHHKDPFDRLLIAQAIEEGLQLLTSDELLARYSNQVILV